MDLKEMVNIYVESWTGRYQGHIDIWVVEL
jgi:hypothetical protein